MLPRQEFALDLSHADAFKEIWAGLDYEKALALLHKKTLDWGTRVPPLFPAYMNLSSTMRYFGFAHNAAFGRVDEAGILVTIADINPSKIERHIGSFTRVR